MLNWLSDAQEATGIYTNPKRGLRTVCQEFPGLDAFVKIDDLKQKMVWCYNNQVAAERIGFRAATYVREYWTLARMRQDFLHIKRELEPLVRERRMDHV